GWSGEAHRPEIAEELCFDADGDRDGGKRHDGGDEARSSQPATHGTSLSGKVEKWKKWKSTVASAFSGRSSSGRLYHPWNRLHRAAADACAGGEGASAARPRAGGVSRSCNAGSGGRRWQRAGPYVSASATACTWPSTFTLSQRCTIFPSGPIRY